MASDDSERAQLTSRRDDRRARLSWRGRKFDRVKEGLCGSSEVSRAFWVLCLSPSSSRAIRQLLHAQTTSATVSGSVQDSQGGVLPGVTVTLTSRTQGNVLTAVTDGGGRFVFPIVRPDTYTLQATLPGFKTAERTNLVVNANDKLSTGIADPGRRRAERGSHACRAPSPRCNR